MIIINEILKYNWQSVQRRSDNKVDKVDELVVPYINNRIHIKINVPLQFVLEAELRVINDQTFAKVLQRQGEHIEEGEDNDSVDTDV